MSRRWLRVGVLAALVLGGFGVARVGYSSGQTAAPLHHGSAAWHRLTRADRVLVIAPHCDDEVLACGGLLQQARAAGAQVEVVLITNGDGFRVAAQRLFGIETVRPPDYLRMGLQRQRESLTGLASLGIGAKHVTFLGYPDSGTAAMWQTKWGYDQLYKSPHTEADHSPYANSLRPRTPYCGRAVIDDLKAVLKRFRPTRLVVPHSGEWHPDHWAAYCYGMAARYELGWTARLPVDLYLLHDASRRIAARPGQPLPAPLEPDDWQARRLTPQQQQRKRGAIEAYASQLLVLRDYMLQFAAPEEWYAPAREGRLPEVAPGRMVVDGRTEEWAGLAAVLVDPAEHLRLATLPKAADLLSLQAAQEGGRLYLLAELSGEPAAGVRYEVHLHGLAPGHVGAPRNYEVTPGRTAAGVEAMAAGRHLELSLPWERAWTGVMLEMDSHGPHGTLDRTRWVVLDLAR